MYKNEVAVIAINFDGNAEWLSQRNMSCDLMTGIHSWFDDFST